MIRHRLKEASRAALVVAFAFSLYTVAANPAATYCVRHDLPTACTSDTETPYSGVSYAVAVILKTSLQNMPDVDTATVQTVRSSSDDELTDDETNNEEQSTTTDEYLTAENNEDESQSDSTDVDTESESSETLIPLNTATEDEVDTNTEVDNTSSDAPDTSNVLNSWNGRVQGPSGEETYYNLNMSGCVRRAQSMGYDYEYWVRDDGVKMFGDYVIIAADFRTRPLGTTLETSLGTGIVLDTGEFVYTDPNAIDIAVTW